jgi:periplasmic divalent cation tolerance protein
MLIVLTTTSTYSEAAELANQIVKERLGACVQILPQIQSVYLWEGEIQSESEHLLLIKTLPERFEELQKFIVANHSYETPEIAAVEAAKVGEKYRHWLSESLT